MAGKAGAHKIETADLGVGKIAFDKFIAADKTAGKGVGGFPHILERVGSDSDIEDPVFQNIFAKRVDTVAHKIIQPRYKCIGVNAKFLFCLPIKLIRTDTKIKIWDHMMFKKNIQSLGQRIIGYIKNLLINSLC